MSKLYKHMFALVCAAALLTGSFGLSVFALDDDTDVFSETEPIILPCKEIPLYIDNVYIGSGYLVNSVTYVPLLAFTEYMLQDDCAVEWDQETGTATITSEELYISLRTDQNYMVANDRYLYFEDGAYNVNGTIVVPIRELAKLFSLNLQVDAESWIIHIDDSEMAVFPSGSEYYDESDLYWLSHVIFSESGNQPLEGMIGVGNVVLNRANDDTGIFPDSIWGVIHQPGQFDVVASGTLYLAPSEDAVIAAKLCLEGYNTVGDSKWFQATYVGDSWMTRNKTLSYVIDGHYFFA